MQLERERGILRQDLSEEAKTPPETPPETTYPLDAGTLQRAGK
jgi:hypothetical protein